MHLPNPLYKYVPSCRWKNILQDKRIKFSTASELNDPFELLPYISDSVYNVGRVAEVLGLTEKSEARLRNIYDLDTSLSNKFSTFEAFQVFVEENPSVQAHLTSEIWNRLRKQDPAQFRAHVQRKLREEFGIFSMTETWSNLLMWSHYAESHKGFVLGFDTSRAEFAYPRSRPFGEGTHLAAVEYRQERPAMYTLDNDQVREGLFVKSAEWEYEREWRMVIQKPLAANWADNVGPVVLIDPLAIADLVLGVLIDPQMKASIIDVVKQDFRHVVIYQATLDGITFELNREPIQID
ncbi:MAG TPA: DUF2971 domain-containing protein [Capsulimonadaceae bacterium]|jgi:hypothetical protein